MVVTTVTYGIPYFHISYIRNIETFIYAYMHFYIFHIHICIFIPFIIFYNVIKYFKVGLWESLFV